MITTHISGSLRRLWFLLLRRYGFGARLLDEATVTSTTSAALGKAPYISQAFWGWIKSAATIHGIRPTLLAALIWHESGFNPRAIGDGGAAHGLCQMHEAACIDVGESWQNMFNPRNAIYAGAAYLGNQYKTFKTDVKSLLAYNQGPSTAAGSPKTAAYAAGIKYAGDILAKEKVLLG